MSLHPQPGKPAVPMTLTRCSGCGYDAWRGNYPCYRCGVVMPPVKYVAVDALLSADALEAATREYAGPTYWDSDQPEKLGGDNRAGYRAACRRCIEAALSAIGGN